MTSIIMKYCWKCIGQQWLENVVELGDGAANKVWLAVVKRQCCNWHGEDGSGASEGLKLVVCKFPYIVLASSKLPTAVDRRICGDGNGDGIGCKEGVKSESSEDGSRRSHKGFVRALDTVFFLSFLSPFWVGWDYGGTGFPMVMVAIGLRMCWGLKQY